ncbi:hypothetical protein ACVWY2_002815 [Bradyrhizobium sp. JR6.1]
MHQDRADENEIPDTRSGCGTRQMQRALDIDVAIQLYRLFVGLLVNAGGEMNDGVHAIERGAPIGGGTERADHHLVCILRRRPNRTADHPAIALQFGHHMATNKAAGARHQNRPAAIIHVVRSTSRLDSSSRTSAA